MHIKFLHCICGSGGMADAQVSDACGGNTVWVRLPSPAPNILYKKSFFRQINACRMQWC